MKPRVRAPARRRIQSIEVGFRLIRVLERAGGMLPLSVIAEKAEMPASKAHLYMVSFTELGLVVQDPTTMRYGLGPYALQLGAAALRQIDVVNVARGPMSLLQEQTGVLIFLSTWGNRGPVIVSKVDGTVEVLLSVRVGYVLPLYRAATGRVFLAYLPRSVVKPVLDREADVDDAIKRRAEESLVVIRRERLAISDSQLNAGFASMSAPIFDYAGDIAAAVTALGLRNEINLDLHGPVAKLVRETAEEISGALGCLPDAEVRAPAVLPQGRPRLSAERRTARKAVS